MLFAMCAGPMALTCTLWGAPGGTVHAQARSLDHLGQRGPHETHRGPHQLPEIGLGILVLELGGLHQHVGHGHHVWRPREVGDQHVDPTRLLDHVLDGGGIGVIRFVGGKVGPLPEELDDRWTDVALRVGHEDPAFFQTAALIGPASDYTPVVAGT
jgi:hypothetical protein